jgi:hypothetical protein
VSQQINLYNPRFLAQKKVFSAKAMAQALGVLVLGCVALGLYGQHNSANLAAAASAGAAQLAQKQARLDKINVEFAPRQRNPALESELAQLEARAQLLRNAAGALDRDELGNKTGYARAFKALARQSIAGLWLTGVSIDSGAPPRGLRVNLEGRALDAALVPAYLGRLGQESVLAGQSFSTLRIGPPKPSSKDGAKETPAPFVEFAVAGAQGKTAGEGAP